VQKQHGEGKDVAEAVRIAVVDIGGTAMKSAVWDGSRLTEQRECPTRAWLGGAAVVELAKKVVRDCGQVDAIGISTAGQVDTVRGVIHYANDNIPGYTGMPVQAMMEEAFHVPAAVENDVNAAALGEMAGGAAKGLNNFLCLTYGTGVGGAIIMDGRLYTGSSFSAGSFGGIVVHPESREEGKEFSGCYERYASVTALVQMAEKVDPALKNGRKIFEAAGIPAVKAVIDSWIDEIAIGLITLIHVFNPSDIILGGGVMEQEYVRKETERRLNAGISDGFKGVRLRAAKLGNCAGLMGAAFLAEKLLGNSTGTNIDD